MKEILRSIVIGVIVGLLLKALDKYGGIDAMKSIYQTFIVELWPMWIGLLAASLYWIIADYIKLRRFSKDLKKWIGYFSYPDGKGGYLYIDLKGKIKRYIQEELEILDKKIREIAEETIIEKRLNDNDPDALKAFLDELKSKNS